MEKIAELFQLSGVQPRAFHTVGDAMTRGALICATVDTTVDEGKRLCIWSSCIVIKCL